MLSVSRLMPFIFISVRNEFSVIYVINLITSNRLELVQDPVALVPNRFQRTSTSQMHLAEFRVFISCVLWGLFSNVLQVFNTAREIEIRCLIDLAINLRL